jgi:argininosuccinate synthase
VDTQRIVLAFNGTTASCAAVRWLKATCQAEVAALIVDVGQATDLEEVRARALTCGAVRAHVVDRCEVFARELIVPAAAAAAPIDDQALRRLAHPVIAAALVEVAAIERADAVAYAAVDSSLGNEVRALDPTLRILAPVDEWTTGDVGTHVHHHLLMRPARATPSGAARVTLAFEDGMPVSVNGVTMELRELIEIVSLIGGQYAVGPWKASPALGVLRAAYRVSGGRGSATLELRPGSLTSVDEPAASPALVNHA